MESITVNTMVAEFYEGDLIFLRGNFYRVVNVVYHDDTSEVFTYELEPDTSDFLVQEIAYNFR